MSYYTKAITDETKCTLNEAPLVEGYLRATYGTLDGLDRKTFRREAKKCLAEVRVDPKTALEVAKSYGLVRT